MDIQFLTNTKKCKCLVVMFHGGRAVGQKQLLVCMKKRTNKKYVSDNTINRLALLLREGQITAQEFMNRIYE